MNLPVFTSTPCPPPPLPSLTSLPPTSSPPPPATRTLGSPLLAMRLSFEPKDGGGRPFTKTTATLTTVTVQPHAVRPGSDPNPRSVDSTNKTAHVVPSPDIHKPGHDAKHGDAGDGYTQQQCSSSTFTRTEDSMATTEVGDEEDATEQGSTAKRNISRGIRGRSPHIDAVEENTPHASHSTSDFDHPPVTVTVPDDDVNHDDDGHAPPSTRSVLKDLATMEVRDTTAVGGTIYRSRHPNNWSSPSPEDDVHGRRPGSRTVAGTGGQQNCATEERGRGHAGPEAYNSPNAGHIQAIGRQAPTVSVGPSYAISLEVVVVR